MKTMNKTQREYVNTVYGPSDTLLTQIAVPIDLKKHLNKLKKVKRYNDSNYYPSNLIKDDVYKHTVRCVYRIRQLIPNNTQLERMVWVHDIAELIAGDMMAVEKHTNHVKAQAAAEEEKLAAQQLLSAEDFKLFTEFEQAKDFLKGKGTPPQVQEAIVAKVIDVFDGNFGFHYFFTKWLNKNTYDNKLPKDISFNYFWEYNKQVRENLSKVKLKKELAGITKHLLHHQIQTIQNLWKPYLESKAPQVLKETFLQITKSPR